MGELMMTDDMGISSTTTITDANTTSPITDASPWLTSTSISSVINEYQNYNNNNDIISNQRQRHRRPRTELMNRLSDALSLLPRDIQELIVDRLIQAITSPKEIQLSLNVTNALEEVVAAAAAITANTDGVPVSTIPQSPKHINDESEMVDSTIKTTAAAGAIRDTTSMMTDDDDDDDDDDDMDYVAPFAASDVITCTAMAAAVNKRNPTLPLAAATLAALLSQYQEQQCAAAVVAATQHDENKSSKGLIPVHVS